MAGIEVLAPLRIETRFAPPDPASGRSEWLLRLRVFPDEFSMARAPLAPTKDELDRLDEALAAPFLNPPVDTAAAFSTLAAAIGAQRAVWLMRTTSSIEVDGVPKAERSGQRTRDPAALPATQKPFGLPPEIDVWLVPKSGPRIRAATMTIDRDAVAADLDLATLTDQATIRAGELPKTWWTSFARAIDVGLGVEIILGPTEPDLEAIIVTGLGDADPLVLVQAHAAAGRMAVLAQGTPTNTVEGEPTTELGRDSSVWLPLLSATASEQPAAAAITEALTGSPLPVPLLGGGLDPNGPAPTLVAALWPALWGRSIRDVAGASKREAQIAHWATHYLAPEGPYPAIRVGEQPYGILPATALGLWVPNGGDPEPEPSVVEWARAWRQLSAEVADGIGTAVDASTERLLSLLGETAPNREWGVRPIAPLAVAQALRATAGMQAISTTPWDDATATTLAGLPHPLHPLAPVGTLFPLPRDPRDRWDKPQILDRLAQAEPWVLLEWQDPLGLLGHLVRETMILLRAVAGLAFRSLVAGDPVDPDAPLPLWPPSGPFLDLLGDGTNANLATLEGSGEPGAMKVAERFRDVQKAIFETIALWAADSDRVFAALLATLDTASHRVDPWVIGIANRRLKALIRDQVPFRLGVYGWVDRPRPYIGAAGGPLAPGPTAAGVLHAPSYGQALTSALLRDAAVRHPGDERWNITIDSAKTRAAVRLAERVRLGVHPYEALGLEVERLVGDWNAVRVLRDAFPLRDTDAIRRCCDGARVLRAVLHGAEAVPAGLPNDLQSTLKPLDLVLDTYADLLVADGINALVLGRGDLANAAMEAAAGLGAPPDLRGVRTARAAKTLRVSAWALLPPADAPADPSPALAADPAFAALLDSELGLASTWQWRIEDPADPETVSFAERGLHGADLLGLEAEAINALIRGPHPDGVAVRSAGGGERLAEAERLAELLGGGDEAPPVPDPTSGRDDERSAASGLREAMLADLATRLAGLVALAVTRISEIDAVDAGDPAVVAGNLAKLASWRLGVDIAENGLLAAREVLAARIAASTNVERTVNGLRAAIRSLSGNRRLPVLPMVARAQLPMLAPVPEEPDGRPTTDREWLEIVAAVRPRLALLEARQLDLARTPWPAALHAAEGHPWTPNGPVVVAYGPAASLGARVAITALDAWVDSVPSSDHATSAAFGFNGPKSRPPQAILIGVPPDNGRRMTADELAETVLETRLLVRARAARPGTGMASRVATPSPFLCSHGPASFLQHWEEP